MWSIISNHWFAPGAHERSRIGGLGSARRSFQWLKQAAAEHLPEAAAVIRSHHGTAVTTRSLCAGIGRSDRLQSERGRLTQSERVYIERAAKVRKEGFWHRRHHLPYKFKWRQEVVESICH